MKPNPLSRLPAVRLLLLTALLALGSGGCMPPPSMPRYAIPPIGAVCKIQLRRDALGAGAAGPIPPRTDVFNGAETSVSGTLRQFTTEWIVLDVAGQEVWIPKTVVLLIEVQPVQKTR